MVDALVTQSWWAVKPIASALEADSDSGEDAVIAHCYEVKRLMSCVVAEYADRLIASALEADSERGGDAVNAA